MLARRRCDAMSDCRARYHAFDGPSVRHRSADLHARSRYRGDVRYQASENARVEGGELVQKAPFEDDHWRRWPSAHAMPHRGGGRQWASPAGLQPADRDGPRHSNSALLSDLGRHRTVEPIDEPCLALSEQSMPAPPARALFARTSTLDADWLSFTVLSTRSLTAGHARFDRSPRLKCELHPLRLVPRPVARGTHRRRRGRCETVIATIAPSEGGRRDHQARARNGRRSARYGGKSWANLGDSPRFARGSPPPTRTVTPRGRDSTVTVPSGS